MKLKLLSLFSILLSLNANAQCGGIPPPIGLNPVYAVDLDNDGITTFDIAYYVEHYHIPLMEQIYQVSASGYSFEFLDSSLVLTNMTYTNIINNEICYLREVYSGSGPTFDPQPPCYWPAIGGANLRLTAVPFDGDMDGDGILNRLEDTNNNGNLMDDDDDNDGIINLLDNTVTLGAAAIEKFDVKLYPNPVTNGIVTFDKTIEAITIYDFTGKLLMKQQQNTNTLDVSTLAPGTYLLKLEVNNEQVFKKIVRR